MNNHEPIHYMMKHNDISAKVEVTIDGKKYQDPNIKKFKFIMKISKLTSCLALIFGVYSLGVIAVDYGLKPHQTIIQEERNKLDKKKEQLFLEFSFYMQNLHPDYPSFLDTLNNKLSLLKYDYHNLDVQKENLYSERFLSWLYFLKENKPIIYKIKKDNITI